MKKISKLFLSGFLLINLVACSQPNKKQNAMALHSDYANNKDASIIIDTNWKEKVVKTEDEWKKLLTEEQFAVSRKSGTEKPFSHPYNDNKEKGVYVCVACKNPLFESDTKFNSGTGWPSFFNPYSSKSVHIGEDNSIGMTRDEVTCARCDAHLGHVFDDGPKPTGKRYCMNGVCLQFTQKQHIEKAVFAQGCFWCVEEIFESVKGVKEVVSGYAGGTESNPTYEEVGSGSTSHAESVEVWYNPEEISYEQLLKVYFNAGDITQVLGQGPDHGKQYRSIIFYKNDTQKKQAEDYISTLNASGKYSSKVSVEVVPFTKFYNAEDYHQNYIKLHPNVSYVTNISIPRYEKAIKNFPELLKK